MKSNLKVMARSAFYCGILLLGVGPSGQAFAGATFNCQMWGPENKWLPLVQKHDKRGPEFDRPKQRVYTLDLGQVTGSAMFIFNELKGDFTLSLISIRDKENGVSVTTVSGVYYADNHMHAVDTGNIDYEKDGKMYSVKCDNYFPAGN